MAVRLSVRLFAKNWRQFIKMTHLFNNYGRFETEIVSGKGLKVLDQNGKEYVDFTSGIGVCNLGHCHEQVTKAAETQLKQLWHISNLFQSSLQEQVAEKLINHSFDAKVFFCNSCAEANEAALKLARKYTGKEKVITFNQSFHGRTFGTMAATGQDKIKQGFGKMLETFVHVPYNDLAAVKAEIDEETAAVMLEVIQGEGGVNPADADFLQALSQLCKEHNILLILDEIQTGIGRTGKPFAYQHFDIQPNIITSAKALGNGLPVGALIAQPEIAKSFQPGSHGSTFGGNPVAMAAANETISIIFKDEFLQAVQEKGDYLANQLREKLAGNDQVVAIRHKGLMFGIELKTEVASYMTQLREKGLLVLVAGPNVIRLLPALTVTYDEMDTAVQLIAEILNQK